MATGPNTEGDPRPWQLIRARVGPGDAVVLGRPPGPDAQKFERILRADAEGRWITIKSEGRFLHRTMDGRVVRRAGSRAFDVSPPDAAAAHEEARALAASFGEALAPDSGAHVQRRGECGADLEERLERVLGWPAERHDGEPARFAGAYPEPVEILPPDRYRDVVVMPAAGCPSADCDFCAFYRGTPFRVLAADEFAAHLDAVAALFGPALALRDGVFLGSASALSLSDRRLAPCLEAVAERIGIGPRGVGAFLDPDHAPRRSAAEFEALRGLGLALAVIGLETGHGALRRDLGKAESLDRVRAAIDALAEAGVARGLTVLVGPGGADARAEHERATTDAVAVMPLVKGDRIYLSPLRGSMPDEQLAEAGASLRASLRAVTGAQVVPYSMERFRYYA